MWAGLGWAVVGMVACVVCVGSDGVKFLTLNYGVFLGQSILLLLQVVKLAIVGLGVAMFRAEHVATTALGLD